MNHDLATPEELKHRKYAVIQMHRQRCSADPLGVCRCGPAPQIPALLGQTQGTNQIEQYVAAMHKQRSLWHEEAVHFAHMAANATTDKARDDFRYWQEKFNDLADGLIELPLHMGGGGAAIFRPTPPPAPQPPPIDYFKITREVAA